MTPDGSIVRFALVGCGDVGARNAKALEEAQGAQLTRIFDPIPALAQNLARQHGSGAVDSLAAALESPDIDAVLIATPHDTHEEVVRAALEAGKHVLLEKPLAADLDGARRIVRMAEQGDQAVGVLFPLRTDRRFLRAVEAIESDPAARPVGAASTYLFQKPQHYFSGGYSNRSPSTWRQSRVRAGGGVLIMNVLHYLDAVRALIGREADTVVARTARSSEYPEIEDVVSLVVDFGGALATFVGAGSAFDGPGERIELWSSSLRIGLLPDGLVAHADGRRSEEADFEPLPRLQSRVDFISAFAHALSVGTEPPVPARDALAVQAIVTAAYTSAAEQRTVCVAEVFESTARAAPAEAKQLAAAAARAVAALDAESAGSVRVIGDGPLARLVKRLVPATSDSGRPRAVIETTGSEENVRSAISEVDTLGTVVLVKPTEAEVVEVAGYSDIHLRGLTVIGLAPATDSIEPPATLVDAAVALLPRREAQASG